MATSLQKKAAESRVTNERILFVMATLFVLLTNQFLSFNPPPVKDIYHVSISSDSFGEHDLVQELQNKTNLTLNTVITQDERMAPIWSAYFKQHYKDVAEYDAVIRWHFVGIKKRLRPKRFATEALTYGLTGVFPWYAYSLPAIQFDTPFTNKTDVDQIRVGGVIDAFLDLHQCLNGRPNGTDRTAPDGYYDACFPNATGRGDAKRLCFTKDHKYMTEKTRLFNYPAQGHQRWSCSDNQVLEQLAAFQVLDFIIQHEDRFWSDRTNNIFFVSNQEPLRFVNIDHAAHVCGFYRKQTNFEFDGWVKRKQPMLKDFQLPSQLRREIKNVVSGSKAEFVRKVNATIDGQFDGVASVLEEEFANECPNKEMFKPTADMIWDRVRSVARFYNLLNSTNDES